ncbi:hypothetical protein [Vibrio anguillarum]|uniref:Uncharacterized protein n=1 Tax=Vibrio anguillarum TaxID=55601 RepID=A0A7U6J3G4_VIBAN|nr:hypothetical protein [Vibrio anguillarum]AZS26316.1 hypothetical protein DYL72_15520 [Vibrio anguillarum]MBF4374461.1 hypothetical protein [Vibrio anguillarum]MBF4438402.1 hypothetical protein [Vibrio anguillarum]
MAVISGIFKHKAWGKSPCLHCTFMTDDGQELTFACFRPYKKGVSSTGIYAPRDGSINFNDDSLINKKFSLDVRKTKSDRPFLYGASLLSE